MQNRWGEIKVDIVSISCFVFCLFDMHNLFNFFLYIWTTCFELLLLRFQFKNIMKKNLIFSQETNIKCTKKSFRFAFLMWLLLLLSWIIIFFLFNLNQNQLLWFRVWWNFISSDEHRHHVNVIWSDIRQWYDAMSHNVEEDFLRILYILYNNNSRLY